MKSALARELRENSGYLLDGGWLASAKLMEAAAAEIERLSLRLAELEQRESFQGVVRAASVAAIFRLFGR